MSIGIVAMTQNQVETLENGTEISLVSPFVIIKSTLLDLF